MFTEEQLEQVINETVNNIIGTDFVQEKMNAIKEVYKEQGVSGNIYENVSEAELLTLWISGYEAALRRFNNAIKKMENGEIPFEF